MVKSMKLRTPVTKNINLKISNQAIHILHNINVINILFVSFLFPYFDSNMLYSVHLFYIR